MNNNNNIHNIIIPFYSSWLYVCASYYDYSQNKELYGKLVRREHLQTLFWNVFIIQPFSLYFIITFQPPTVFVDTFWNEISYMCYNLIFGEFWFYTIHYLFHTKYFYKYHKTHHENNEVVGIFALYAHPIDAVLLNIGSIFLLHYLVVFSCFHIYLIGTVATINTIIQSHTGRKNGFHQQHHRCFTCNYGMDYFMDTLFSTAKK
jgi:sterol desaturase/sphingolipid hydroxylase (fatty acid hydroxylase superfamily)